MSVLSDIQKSLSVPKDQVNDFQGYNYRRAEDILAAVKPLLPDGWHIITNCDVIEVCGLPYQRCVVTLTDGNERFQAAASAREPMEKKGSDASQISGASMSYAKKYALGNLFAIDNERDADSAESSPKFDLSEVEKAGALWAAHKGKDLESTLSDIRRKAASGHYKTQQEIDDLAQRLWNEAEEKEN